MQEADVNVGFRRERWDTPDGDFLDLDFAEPKAECDGTLSDDSSCVLVLPGIDGRARNQYMTGIYSRLLGLGIRPVGLNFRSCSGEPNRRGRLYHAGDTRDPGFVLRRLISRYPKSEFAMMGFSLGGNMILKFVGEVGDQRPKNLRAAAAISPPIDLRAAAKKLETGDGLLFARHILRILKPRIRAKALVFDPNGWADCDGARVPEIQRVMKSRTMREFDETLIAPVHGFRDADEYHLLASSAGILSQVSLPTVVIRADSDPFLGDDDLKHEAFRTNPQLHTLVKHTCGHLGLSGWAGEDPLCNWAQQSAIDFILARLAHEPSPGRVK